MTPAEQTVENILKLEQALLAKHPSMPTLLSQIHKQLKQNPEVVTLLEPEQISTIIRGLQEHTKTTLVAKTMASVTKKKSLRSTTIEDL